LAAQWNVVDEEGGKPVTHSRYKCPSCGYTLTICGGTVVTRELGFEHALERLKA
jgi:transposase-like protein